MKKNVITLAMVFFSIIAFSQVGINTPDPQASLDIQSKGNTASTKAMRINNSNGTEMMTVTDAGRIGVGKILPEGQLHIVTTDANGIISERANATNPSSPAYLTLRRNKSNDPNVNVAVATNDYLGAIIFSGNTGSGYDGNALISNSFIASLASQDFSPASQGSELRFFTVPNGTAASATRMTITNDGNLGIGTITPTSKIDIVGNARIRTMDVAPGAALITPVYSDANGVLNKAVSNVYGTVINNTVNVTAGATAALITGIPNAGVYKAVVSVGNACGRTTIAEYYVTSNAFNNAFSIKGIDGLLNTDTTSKGPVFTEVNRFTTSVAWSGVPNCAGGTGAALSYTLTMPSADVINVTNNGDVSLDYRIILTRLF